MLGARIQSILACVICYKLCGTCNSAKKEGREPEIHSCLKNYDGSSKGMEAHAALELVKQVYCKEGVIKQTMQALFGHRSLLLLESLEHISATQ
eukprot:6568033-Ditylum_brightwellii.AAC.1